jgi:type III secretion protein Q
VLTIEASDSRKAAAGPAPVHRPAPRTAPRPAVPPQPNLATRLPAVDAGEARLARLVRDRRFLPWIDTLVPGAGARLARGDDAPAVLVTLSGPHGSATLSADARAWPALALAAADTDAQGARDVVAILLADALAVLQPWLPGLAVQAVRLGASTAQVLRLKTAAFDLGLHAIDAPLADHLAGLLSRLPGVPAGHLRPLRMPARVGLFTRELSVHHWRSLQPGDVVLGAHRPAPGQRLGGRITFGLGVTMQAAAEIDLDTATVHVADTPAPVPEDLQAAGPPLGAIGELNVPVAFELDSARIGLDELAAIGPGSVIELQAQAMDATVQLVCLGQVIGLGQLVVIGDRLGVRVERMGVGALDRVWSRA